MTPINEQYSNDFLAITIQDSARIVDFITERAKTTSYELLQHLEHQFLYEYFRAKNLIDDSENKYGCQAEAEVLVARILKFRDIINKDDRFVRYKILVGFESVYPAHWTDQNLDYDWVNEYRREKAEHFIDEINVAKEKEWFDLIELCAETKSNDFATFPVFYAFISKLAERKPEIAEKILATATDDIRIFISSFLDGLALSNRREIYERIMEFELESARNLAGVVRHLRHSAVAMPEYSTRLKIRAIETDDSIAVIECLLFTLEHYGTEKVTDADAFLRDTLTFLNDRKDSRWISEAWFLQKATTFYKELTPERITQILQNLGYICKPCSCIKSIA
jgi:hypothetical protein